MSEQDKRAEEVWRELYSWLSNVPDSEEKHEAILAIIAAALRQAYREGVEAMLSLAIVAGWEFANTDRFEARLRSLAVEAKERKPWTNTLGSKK